MKHRVTVFAFVILTWFATSLSANDANTVKVFILAGQSNMLADKEAERLFPGWQNHFEEWKKVGSDRPYHYLGSAIWFNRIGKAMGESMLELIKNRN